MKLGFRASLPLVILLQLAGCAQPDANCTNLSQGAATSLLTNELANYQRQPTAEPDIKAGTWVLKQVEVRQATDSESITAIGTFQSREGKRMLFLLAYGDCDVSFSLR